jgi:hypothetical protein
MTTVLYFMKKPLGNFEVYERDEICGSLLRMISPALVRAAAGPGNPSKGKEPTFESKDTSVKG